MSSTETFARKVSAILRSADALSDEAVSQVLKLLAQMQSAVTHELLTKAETFSAVHLTAIRQEIAAAAQSFVRRYQRQVPDIYNQAWQLGLDLADGPLAAAGISTVAGIVPRAVLETLQGYSVDLVQGLARTAVVRLNAVVAQATLGVISPYEAIQQVAGNLPGRSVFPSLQARASTIVRTEVGRTFSVAHEARFQQQAQAVPGLQKEWLTAEDERVRPTHQAAQGQIVKADATFTVGGESARFPRDPTLSAGESINCRCWSIPYVSSEVLAAFGVAA